LAESRGQAQAIFTGLLKNAFAAIQHVAVKESVGQQFIMLVRGTGAFVHILGDEKLMQFGLQPGLDGLRVEADEQIFLDRIE